MKDIIGVDPAAGEDFTAEAVIKNGVCVSVGLVRKNKTYGESPLAKCVPDLIRKQQVEAFYKRKK